MRRAAKVAASVAAAMVLGLLVASEPHGAAQEAKGKTYRPDAATLERIRTEVEQLRQAVTELRRGGLADEVWVEVAVYLQAVESLLRREEWLHPNMANWALQVLTEGRERARQAATGQTPWRQQRGGWTVRAYRSRIDGSIQPYAVLTPQGGDGSRLDIVLHGRDASLTEVKFLATHGAKAKVPPGMRDYVQLEVFGRGNNAYRWSGETDVFEAWEAWQRSASPGAGRQVVLRGFSMGGAGTWHIGLHHPCRFAVLGPGAGFTTTHGYVARLPQPLPHPQEETLRIYDAVRYAENAYLVPIVAYSGGEDPQKAAADTIEQALRGFPLPLRFTHLVAPGLGHQMPPEWQAKAEAEYRRYVAEPPRPREHIRFVTYTVRYPRCEWVEVLGLGRHYDKAVVDARQTAKEVTVQTENVRLLRLQAMGPSPPQGGVVIDGQRLPWAADRLAVELEKRDGQWRVATDWAQRRHREKTPGLQGPIDDAFRERFFVVGPEGDDPFAAAALEQFRRLWDRYFRGQLPVLSAAEYDPNRHDGHLVLFGTPWSNPWIARLLPQLPIVWTRQELIVNGTSYDGSRYRPVLVVPSPLRPGRYVVLNSGHTFGEADLRGTNALLYPRLGDWGVIRPAATPQEPVAYGVVASGLCDEYWQLPGPAAGRLEKLWGEGAFTEGPTEGPDGCIYFSDIGNRIMKYDPASGRTSVYREPSGRSNGLKFDARGRLVACEGANTGGGRRVSITELDGTVRTLADRYQGKRFNSPNDLTIDSRGRIYFSDPRYVGDEPRELNHESVYRIDPDGTVTRLTTDTVKPNGLVLSPDEKTLYVSDHSDRPDGPRLLVAYPIREDGTLGPRRVLYDFGPERGIDGMTVLPNGVIVATAGSGDRGGIYFFSPSGQKLAVLPTPEAPNNCCLAGSDKQTLYITAGKSLYRVRLAWRHAEP